MDSELELQLKKLREQINSKAPHQQQHAATLLAVEETIKEQNTTAEPSGYFAALLTLLEQQAGPGHKGLSNAIIYLLSIVLPHVSSQVLRAKFTTMMAVLSQSLDLGSADVALLRSVVSCLETVLVSQDAGSWNQPIAQGTFKSLLALSTDSKPKIRKRAQEAVSVLLSQPPPPAAVHPAASIAVRFVLDMLSNAKADTQSAIYTLQLVKLTDMIWPPEEFKELCEALMQLSKLNTPFLTSLSFQSLEALFSNAAESLDEDQFRDLLVAVIDLKPNVNDSTSSESWLKIVQNGYITYASISTESCFESLPDLIDLVFPDIELGKQSTKEAATQCIWAMIRDCIPISKLGSEGIWQIVKTLTSGLSYRYRESWKLIFLLIAALFQRLGSFAHPTMDALTVEIANMRMEPEFQFKTEADAVLGAAIRAIGPKAFLQMLPLNLNVANRKDEVGRAWLLPLMKSHVRNAPLQYFVSTMLPLADNLVAQSLRFTSQGREIEAKVFIALYHQVWALLSGFCNVPSDIVVAFTPDFAARLASEMQEDPMLRPSICAALHTLLTAIQALAHKEMADGPLTKQQALAAEQHLARFAPDFLSHLFNVFAQSPGASRGYLVDTITAFLAVISTDEVNATFVKVCTMLDEALKTHKPPEATELTERYLEAHPPPHAHTMVDLAAIMIPYLDTERASMFTRAAFLLAQQSDDTVLQKKGYKAIVRLAEQPAGSPARQLIESSINDQLIPMLIESAETVSASSRRERLALISLLSQNLQDNQLHFIPALLSEVIVGAKEANERARNIAFDTLLVMGRRMAQGGDINMAILAGDSGSNSGTMQRADIQEYFKIITAGLTAQTPHMISATIAAISRALFEFHEQLGSDYIIELMSVVLMFVVNNNREIAKASLGYVKVISVILPKEILEPHLKDIVPAILKWSHEYKNQLRLKCRHILERLARRLGLETVAKSVPEEHMKLVVNMRKRQQRAKKAKEGGATGGHSHEDTLSAEVGAAASAVGKKSFGNAYEDVIYGSESELEDSDDERFVKAAGKNNRDRKAKKQLTSINANTSAASGPGAWIKEDTDGPLDFLDRLAFTHFATSDPASKPRRAISVPKMKNGKLFFEDPEEEARKARSAAAAEAVSARNGGENGVGDADEGDDYYLQSLKSKDGYYRAPNQKIKFHKRKAGDSDDDVEMASDNDDSTASAQQSVGATKRGKNNNGVAYGREFKSKKGKGDIKRGSIDPFAYIPLNPKNMKNGLMSIKGNSKKEKRARSSKK
ncbi:pre-rRNA processing protein [Coemansia spiralis]|uniref:Pre-rRNA processing protein n=2 Tax=Coemansia TaxID=4863 RepID=A0A9W8G6M4_9FUNG|nr:pre-rRNA processing protein [Coemansia umbellata]KAJ2621093.1 pre-rRNA processing protein [Coemansia sp. RSA 1358]KAJ2680193.1 pre-rRNA processing protein [Coemansia spiralis]